MKICLDPLSKAAKGLRQGVKKCVQSAVAGKSKDDERLHHMRVTIKRLRAYLRLLRPHLKNSFYRKENRRLRDAARTLSDLRDAQATRSLLKDLAALEKKRTGQGHLSGVAKILGPHPPPGPGKSSTKDPAAPVAAELQDFAKRFQHLDVGKTDGWKLLKPGLIKSFSQTQDTFQEAWDSRQADAFHEWRKRLKYLRFQIELLLKTDSAVVPGLYQALYDMELALGHHHDLFLLVQQISRIEPGAHLASGTRDHAALFLASCIQEEELNVLDMGRRVFVSEGFDLVKVLDQELG